MFSPAAFLARPMRWLECIARERGTISAAPNFAYELCVDKSTPEERAALDLSSWRTAMCGAEPVRAKTLDRFAEAFAPAGFRREAFHPVYGLAESTLLVTGGVTAETPAVRHLPHGTFVGCGRPAVDHDVVIVDPESGEPCQAEQVGEIWASGPSVAHGYWNRSAETTATFQARLADGRGPFLRTGDLGCILDGELVIVGRLKDLIIVRGQNHYPDDIEATVQECHPVLLRHRGAAFAADPDGAGERLVLVQEVDRHGARDADLDDVLGRIRIAVTEAHDVQVAEILLVRPLSVPTTSSGKIRRSACRDRYLGGDLSPVARWTAPEARTPIPEPRFGGSHGAEEITRFLVERIASAVNLSPGEIDQEQPFAYYGLDSARAAQLSAELQAWLGRELPATLPYEYPTIHLLTRHLVGEDTASADPRAARELLVRLPGLSDDAVDRVLRGMLTGGSGPP
jgi:acyl-CoA synthetase (AMP-forming)/AMP-acid ligase II/acyl carrier protein